MNTDSRQPRLNFPEYDFRIRTSGSGTRIWDEVRRKWLILTPEEWVRQNLLRLLTGSYRIPAALIREECPVTIGGMVQRADVLVYSSSASALLLAECKAPHIPIDRSTFDQVFRYNTVFGAAYVMVTNGIKHYIFERGQECGYRRLDIFPEFDKLL